MPVIQEYKGNKLICLNPGSQYEFKFGISKAKLILNNLKAIENFVLTEGESLDDKQALELENDPFI